MVMALEKRFGEYETLGELFAGMGEDVGALTLWRRIPECIKHLMDVLCRHLGITVDELVESIINDEEAAKTISSWQKLLKATSPRDNTFYVIVKNRIGARLLRK